MSIASVGPFLLNRKGLALSAKELEEGARLLLDFKKLRSIAEKGLDVLPVAVQNIDTSEVI
jgi:hypothetical protein